MCLEGEVSQTSATEALKRGKRAAGDLIPWTISGCFQDEQFPSLSGARIVRIATHPDYQSVSKIKINFDNTLLFVNSNDKSF